MNSQPNWWTQDEYDIRCEWGLYGVQTLAPISDAVIIVDVLSFSTSVSIAVDNGAFVYPYAGSPDRFQAYAESVDAEIAGMRASGTRYSLSPSSLAEITSGTRIVLPSPNGSTLSKYAGATPTFAGCLRNAYAVADAAMRVGPRIAVIPAGERWRDDGSLRPSLEDMLGAGAIISRMSGLLSAEAEAALAVYRNSADSLQRVLLACSSGRELVERGNRDDVVLAAELNVSRVAPLLVDGAYRNADIRL